LGTVKNDRKERIMTTDAVEAVYEHGGFRLVAPVDLKLAEGQKVRLVVEPIEQPDEILALAAQVYEGFTSDEIDSIEEHSRRHEDFFGDRTPA
jgi:predicted DNA-binding antitoxin AbrB/MazE fold protein